MEKPPPPGVSAIGETGARTPITVDPPTQKKASAGPKGQKRQVPRGGDHVLRNLEATGRRVVNMAPAGVQEKNNDVIELPMPNMKMPASSTCSFQSVDGLEYVFRIKDAKGRPVPYRNEMALYLAMIEVAKGGTPEVVFDAFKLKIDDFHGKRVYPISPFQPEVWDSAEVVDEEPVEEEGPKGFTLGE